VGVSICCIGLRKKGVTGIGGGQEWKEIGSRGDKGRGTERGRQGEDRERKSKRAGSGGRWRCGGDKEGKQRVMMGMDVARGAGDAGGERCG